jgi:hypothetical protein
MSAKPIVGERTEARVETELAELADQLDVAGVKRITAVDLVVMSKAPVTDGPDPDNDRTRPLAIPPRVLWPALIRTALVVDEVVRGPTLESVDLRFTGYRPADYNKAVGGTGTAHVWACAIDVWVGNRLLGAYHAAPVGKARDKVADAIEDAREKLKLAFAARYLVDPRRRMGFGVYTNDIHFDVEHTHADQLRRTWGDAQTYLRKWRRGQR